MSLTLRTNLSRPLTHEELDGNFTYLNIRPWSKQGYEQGQYVLYGISGVTSLYYCTLTHTDNPYTLNGNNFTTFYVDGSGTHEIWERIGGTGGSGSVTGGENLTGTTYTITGTVGNIFKGQTTGGTLQFKSLYSPDGSVVITYDNGSVYLSTVPAPTATATYSHITTTGVTCYGGSNGAMRVVATGGTGTRKFSIDGGATWRPTVGFNTATSQLYTGLPAGSYLVQIADAILGGVVSTTVVVSTPPKLGFYNNTTTHTNVTVSGMTNGTITVQATGGTAPYKVQLDTNGWNAITGTTYTFTGLTAGNYRVYIQDTNGCNPPIGNITTPITYDHLRMSLSSAAPIHPACHNGTGAVTATVINGSGNYQYSLDGGAFGSTTSSPSVVFGGLTAGSGHYISIKDMANGQIISTSTLTLNNPAAMTFQTTGVTNVACGSGNTDIYVKVQNSVGVPQIQFPSASSTWYNMTASTPAGSFIFHTSGDTLTLRPYFNVPGTTRTGILKIKDSACTMITGSTSYNVHYYSQVAFTSVVLSTPPSCPGDAWIYTLGFTGGSGSWDLSLDNFSTLIVFTGSTAVVTIPMSTTGTTLTTRTVYLRDTNNHSCSTFVNLNNSRITAITATGITTNPSCSGGLGSVSITAQGGRVDIGNTYVYALITGGLGGSVGTYGTSSVISGLAAGVYNVYVKRSTTSGCSPASLVGGDFTITVPTAVYGALYQVQNPSTCNGNDGYIRVDVSGGTGTYYVSKDGGGSYNGSPLTPTTSGGHTYITIPSLVAGSYSVLVKDANGCIMTNQSAFPVTLANPTSPGFSVKTYTPPLCFGSNATIKLTATGGTPTYTFSSDGVTYTAPTSGSTKYYSVAVYSPSVSQRFYVKDSLNCVRFVDIFGGTNPAAMTATLTFNTGNHAVVNIVNGTGTKTVTLYNGLTVVDSVSGISTVYTSSGTYAGGSYHAVVTDSNGCTATTNTLSPPSSAMMYYFRYAVDAVNSNFVENTGNFYDLGNTSNTYTNVSTGLPATLDAVVNSFVSSPATYGGGSINLTTAAPTGWGSAVVSMLYSSVGYTNALAIVVPNIGTYTTLLAGLHLKDVSNMIPFNATTPAGSITIGGAPYYVYNVFATSQSGSAVTTITIS